MDKEIADSIKEIKETAIEWSDYMKNFNGKLPLTCPQGHPLKYYYSQEGEYIITCIISSCRFYDYNNVRVSMSTPLSRNIERFF